MRLFHTSDWHLGQSLHGQERDFEHACFLDWLLGQLRLRQPDALLIAGDIFDTVNPPVKAQERRAAPGRPVAGPPRAVPGAVRR